MNDRFYYNNNNDNNYKYTNNQKNLLLILGAIILIVIGYIGMNSGMFDKVEEIETTTERKIVYVGEKEDIKVNVKTNSEFSPTVKFSSDKDKFTLSENMQVGKEVEAKIIGSKPGEDKLIVEAGKDGKKEKVTKIEILVCDKPEITNTSDKIINIKEESIVQLNFNVNDECLKNYDIKIENEKIAKLDNNYNLIAKKSGTTNLVLKRGSSKTTYRINVKPLTIAVKSVKINTKSFNLATGKTKKLSISVLPSDATNRKVTYTSSDESIATVTTNGTVKGINVGIATITITSASDPTKTSSITVKIYKQTPISKETPKTISVTEIKFDKTSETMYEGESKTISTTVTPSNATNKTITCTSSSNSIATVSVSNNSCVVKGVKAGTVTITATTKDGNKTGTIKVTVSKKPTPTVSVTSVKFDKPNETMYEGESKILSTTVTPTNATNKTITCTSSSNSIATVSVSGNSCVVKGVKAGTVTITATTKDGNKTGTIKVTVSKKPTSTVSVTSVKFEKSSYSVSLNQTIAAVVGIKPTNATNKTVTCKSLNTGIATVTYSGNICTIKGIKVGTATIEAYSSDGNKKATTEVKVLPIAVTSISFENASYSMNVGASKIMNVKFNPTNASNQVISCASSNNSIATAVAKGASCVVEGVAAGSVTITATSQDGNKKAQATVTCISQNVNVNINNGLKIYYLALGRIDGILIQGNGTTIFIDGGKESHGQRCVEFMKEIGITKLDAIIGSHMHDNHINAHTVIANNFPVGAAYYPDDPRTCKANKTCGDGVEKAHINKMVNKLNEKNIPINILTPKMNVKIGNLTFDILGPLALGTKVNNNSLHMILKYGNQKFYFSGDSGPNVFKDIYNKYDHNVFANITVFKHPHHGQNEVPSDFITVMNPKYVVVPGNTKSKAGSEYKGLDTVIYLLEGALADKKTVITGAGANLKGYLLVEADGKNIKITDKRK